MEKNHKKKIMFICAEASGDMLVSEIIDGLRDNNIQITSSFIGEACQKKGVSSIADLSSVAKMGFFEVLTLIPTVFRLREIIMQTIKDEKPDMIICVDGFAFTHFVAKKVKKQYPHIKLVRYIAPKLWAWGRWRAKKLKNFYDLILCCLPFEPNFFKSYGITTQFIGHTVVERFPKIDNNIREKLRDKYHLYSDKKTILLLPGSRHSEISQLLPIFIETANKLGEKYHYVIPVAQGKEKHFQHLGNDFKLIYDADDKFGIFQIADCALAASGTVSLELMMSNTPTIITYKISCLSWLLAKYLVTVKYVSLINIIFDKYVLPEFLQEKCNPDILSDAIEELVNSKEDIDLQRKYYEICIEKFGGASCKKISTKVVNSIDRILN